MKSIRPAFQVWDKYISELPPVNQNITCNMIFDVKMGKTLEEKRDLFQMGTRLITQLQ